MGQLTVNYYGASSALQHCTVDTANRLVTASWATVTARNSVFATIATNSSGTVSFSGSQYNGFYQSTGFGTAQFGVLVSPFQAVGAGGRYLAAGSSLRNAGATAGIDTGLLNDLKQLTTYAPLVLTQAVTTATVLAPQAPRDTGTPDLGYHYPSVDYAVSGVGVKAGLNLTNGVVVMTFGNVGFELRDHGQLVSAGRVGQPNRLTRYYHVQEGPVNWGGGTVSSMVTLRSWHSGVAPPGIELRFTELEGGAGSGRHLYSDTTSSRLSGLTMRDTGVWGGEMMVAGPSGSALGLNNNLFERVTFFFQGGATLGLYNNLFRHGSVYAANTGSGNWVVRDNAFDRATIVDVGTSVGGAYNAYIGMGTNRFYPTNANDRPLTSFVYASGPLGEYYHSSTNLLNAGSRGAHLAGLYHHTVLTSQVKEGTTQVDIGYHYVATLPGTAIPQDTDGDGIPDYLEDRNGNGVHDPGAGETNWQQSENGTTGVPGLQVFPPLE
jgi:hypothetical protein